MSYRTACLVALFLVLCTHADAQQSYNLALIKRDTQIFERIIQEVLKQHFKTPFALAAEPKGAYLQGYGVVVSFQLNLSRSGIRSPFQLGRSTAPSPRMKTEEQVRLVRDSMVGCLADYGNTMKQLGSRERISIHAQVINRNELDPMKSETVLVLTALKRDIEMLNAGHLTLEAFKQKVQVVEY